MTPLSSGKLQSLSSITTPRSIGISASRSSNTNTRGCQTHVQAL